jgi:BCD family chlorophyll transporter-like MFS transporter
MLGAGAVLAAQAIALMQASLGLGIALAVVAYSLIGAGVAAAGTSLLALMASAVTPQRRPAAAATTWILMLVGIVATAIIVGKLLTPYSPQRLLAVAAGVAVFALGLASVAVWGVERAAATRPADNNAPRLPFFTALRETWADTTARRFTIFVFVSMLAFNAQDMILEPFMGMVFHLDVGQSTQISGSMHQGGVLIGMVLIGALGARTGGHTAQGMRRWIVVGCLGSAGALAALAAVGMTGFADGLRPVIFALGFCNGVFAVAAVGAMFTLAGAGGSGREGVRIGVWGAAQAMAFGSGGFLGAVSYDVLKLIMGAATPAYSTVFALEGLLFVVAAALAVRLGGATLDGLARAPALPNAFAAEQISLGGRQ